jgi:hypothetical protein
LAEQRKLDVELRDELAEGAPFAALLALLDDLAVSHAVLSAHGDLIPAAVEHAERAGALIVGERGWKKGSTWTLEREAGMFVRATYLPAPDPDPPGPKRRRAYERRGRWGRGG